MTHEFALLLALAGAFIVLIISPGPNFLVITQLSIGQSRQQGICAGLGVASGSIVWALLAATGLGLVFQRLPFLQPALQVLGGTYLIWLGSKSLRSPGKPPAPRNLDALDIGGLSRAYRFGLLTNMTNPKALAFYTSVFTTVSAPELPMWVRGAGVALIAVLAISWFVLLATLFSVPAVRVRYQRMKKPIDIITGLLMVAFGLRLLIGLIQTYWLN
ncbi:LysE family transporter [Pseudomonas putida]|uniref:LysE family transporter n=1 Tax=Pseudomonas putida TaxID=303 RepID=A0A7W2L400_PSEPU|nr:MULTISPECIES: LysE family transporter [Pseudomonas]MBA6118049.1 LysE family transporter [Pseudomonas putida]MBI6943816.1 LysE family transporter [Pseudomonas putida]MBI6959902.1 LysE family transporter [Pseudomonas putida]MCZ9637695.1 LysE family transporter [Pseudomonas putida]MEC4876694.1 LysE family transporter [Pseudomonas sp. NC26]